MRALLRALSAVALAAVVLVIGARAQVPLPRVLVLGDTTQRPALDAARKALAGRVELVVPTDAYANDTGEALARLDELVGESEWDLVYFGFGLGDLVYRDPRTEDRRTLARGAGGVRTTSDERYRENLVQLVTRLEETGAPLLWASTTPTERLVIGNSPVDNLFDAGAELALNRIAAEVMAAHDIPVVDLHAFCMAQFEDGKHPGFLDYARALSKREGGPRLHEPIVEAILARLDGEDGPARPGLVESDGQITVDLGGSSILKYSVQPFRLRSAEVGAATLEVGVSGSSRFRIGDDRPAAVTATSWRRAGSAVEFELNVFPRPEGPAEESAEGRRLVETLTAVTCGDARGYRRSVHQNPAVDPLESGREWPPCVWFGPHEVVGPHPATTLIQDHYGHSTVSDPGITYELRTLALSEGAQVWIFRSFHHVLNQANNPGIDPRLEETVLVAGPDSKLELGDLLAELVENPRDRKALLQRYAPARLEDEDAESGNE